MLIVAADSPCPQGHTFRRKKNIGTKRHTSDSDIPEMYCLLTSWPPSSGSIRPFGLSGAPLGPYMNTKRTMPYSDAVQT